LSTTCFSDISAANTLAIKQTSKDKADFMCTKILYEVQKKKCNSFLLDGVAHATWS
jgi:1,2-phenylacetyl-CoA epoxidase PaaB subunit